MSRIRSKNTKPEKQVRSILHGKGFRFRLHSDKLPGKPDIILSKYKTIIFVHGCFWHRHKNCKNAAVPKSKTDFWNKKFASNIKRDKEVKEKLKILGWKTFVIWECEVKQRELLERRVQNIIDEITGEK